MKVFLRLIHLQHGGRGTGDKRQAGAHAAVGAICAWGTIDAVGCCGGVTTDDGSDKRLWVCAVDQHGGDGVLG